MAETALAAPSLPVAATAKRSLSRIAGLSGLAFVALVGAQNVIVGAASPPAGDASTAKIAEFIDANKTVLSVAVGVVPFAVLALYAFIAGATARLSRGSGEAAAWTRLGMSGLVVVGPLFLSGILFEYVLLAKSEDLAAWGSLTETLWQLRNAALILTGIGLAVALLGLSRAARLNGLIPAWHEGLGFAAAGGFLVAAAAAVPAVEGAPIGFLGFAAFVAWLLWLALTSVRLLREPDTAV